MAQEKSNSLQRAHFSLPHATLLYQRPVADAGDCSVSKGESTGRDVLHFRPFLFTGAENELSYGGIRSKERQIFCLQCSNRGTVTSDSKNITVQSPQ